MTLRSHKSKFLFHLALAVVILLGTHRTALAQDKIRAAYSSISGIFTPVWIATDLRLYQKHQTDADLVYIGGSAVAVSALIAGEIDLTPWTVQLPLEEGQQAFERMTRAPGGALKMVLAVSN